MSVRIRLACIAACWVACSGSRDASSQGDLAPPEVPDVTEDAPGQQDASLDSHIEPEVPDVVQLPLDSQPSDLSPTDLPTDVVASDQVQVDSTESTDAASGCSTTAAPGSDSDCPVPGTPCDDGNPCTTEDHVSSDGTCSGQLDPCDDGEPCTQDHCWAAVGCTHVWTPGCGGKPCGECPGDLGFTCKFVSGDDFTCVNEATDEVFVPGGIFWFGWNDKVLNSFCLSDIIKYGTE